MLAVTGMRRREPEKVEHSETSRGGEGSPHVRRRRWPTGHYRRVPTSQWPHPDDVVALVFSLNVDVMLDHAEERGLAMPNTTRMHATRTLQLHWNENAVIISRKQRAFNVACGALALQTVSWIIFIALGREVI